MDALMLAVTGVALALAVGMSVVAVRLLRGERHRSATRVAALEAAALEGGAFDDLSFREPLDDVEPADAFADADADIDFDVEDFHADVPLRPAPARRRSRREIDIDVPTGPMFTATDEPKAPGRRWLALGVVAVVMAALVGTLYTVFKPATVDAASTASASGSAPEGITAPVAASASQTRPIELLSLKHAVDGTTFTLVGLVVNPIDAAPLSRVVAVVYLFDKEGAYFASGKSTLEFPTLRPGEESPFTIKIDHVGRIGKYRVGFRRDDGSVIAHLDKRGQRAGSMTEVGGQ